MKSAARPAPRQPRCQSSTTITISAATSDTLAAMTATCGPHPGPALAADAQASARPGPLGQARTDDAVDTTGDPARDPGGVRNTSDEGTLAGAERASLHDGDVGCFAVRTATGRYLIDLDNRRLLRVPATQQLQRRYLIRTFDVDGHWLPLKALHRCAVGDGMSATIVLDGQPQPLRSSPVQWIRPSRAFWD